MAGSDATSQKQHKLTNTPCWPCSVKTVNCRESLKKAKSTKSRAAATPAPLMTTTRSSLNSRNRKSMSSSTKNYTIGILSSWKCRRPSIRSLRAWQEWREDSLLSRCRKAFSRMIIPIPNFIITREMQAVATWVWLLHEITQSQETKADHGSEPSRQIQKRNRKRGQIDDLVEMTSSEECLIDLKMRTWSTFYSVEQLQLL